MLGIPTTQVIGIYDDQIATATATALCTVWWVKGTREINLFGHAS